MTPFKPVSHRRGAVQCIELEKREWKEFFFYRSMINGKHRLSVIDRRKIPSILFLPIMYPGVKRVLRVFRLSCL